MGTQSKKHHYVPQSLLKGFSIDDAETHVWVFDKRKAKAFRSSIIDAGSENHFNTIEFDGRIINFEDAFAGFDTRLAEVLATLKACNSLSLLTRQDRIDLAALAAIQFYRTKQMRLTYKHLAQQIRDVVQKFAPGSPDSVAPRLSENQIRMLTLRSLNDYRKSVPLLLAKHMVLHQTTTDAPFWISDNPLVVTNYHPWGATGFASPGVEVCWPLSSTLLLSYVCPTIPAKLEAEKPLDAALLRMEPTIQSGPENVVYYNSLQGFQSDRFLYAKSSSFPLMEKMLAELPDVAQEHSRMAVGGSEPGPSHPRMPGGRWLVVIGQRTYHMIRLKDWTEAGSGRPLTVVVDPAGAQDLARALLDGPFSEGTLYVDRQERVGSREIMLDPDLADPLTVAVKHTDPGLQAIMERDRKES